MYFTFTNYVNRLYYNTYILVLEREVKRHGISEIGKSN